MAQGRFSFPTISKRQEAVYEGLSRDFQLNPTLENYYARRSFENQILFEKYRQKAFYHELRTEKVQSVVFYYFHWQDV